MKLWTTDDELNFFYKSLDSFSSANELFYKINNRYFAYVPKGDSSHGIALQSRNSLIGKYTEAWVQRLLEPIAKQHGLYCLNSVVCENIGLPRNSSADIAFCKANEPIQEAKNIVLLFEVKMSIVSNYEYHSDNSILLTGDYKTHKGVPSLLRSDSMLKAIGKSINIRVSGNEGNHIPIIILGNSPITVSYTKKVDYLKHSGVIQGFWSLYPEPTESDHIKYSTNYGFETVLNYKELAQLIKETLSKDSIYFSAMKPKNELGKLIELANTENTPEAKAEKFLALISKI